MSEDGLAVVLTATAKDLDDDLSLDPPFRGGVLSGLWSEMTS